MAKQKVQYLLVNGQFKVHKAGCRDIDKLMKKSDYEQPVDAAYATEYEALHDLWQDQIAEQPGDDGHKATVSFLHDKGFVGATDFAPCLTITPLPVPGTVQPRKKEPTMAPKTTTRTRATKADANGDVAEAPRRVRPSRAAAPAAEPEPAPAPRRARKAAAAPEPEPTPAPRRGRAKATAPEPEPEQQVAAAPKPNKREAKQDLARRAIEALDNMMEELPTDALALDGYTEEELGQALANMVHHFPTGLDDEGYRWWSTKVLPLPDRKEWQEG
jgi:hypothetical protein